MRFASLPHITRLAAWCRSAALFRSAAYQGASRRHASHGAERRGVRTGCPASHDARGQQSDRTGRRRSRRRRVSMPLTIGHKGTGLFTVGAPVGRGEGMGLWSSRSNRALMARMASSKRSCPWRPTGRCGTSPIRSPRSPRASPRAPPASRSTRAQGTGAGCSRAEQAPPRPPIRPPIDPTASPHYGLRLAGTRTASASRGLSDPAAGLVP